MPKKRNEYDIKQFVLNKDIGVNDPEPQRVTVVYTIKGQHDYMFEDQFPSLKLTQKEAEASSKAFAIHYTTSLGTSYLVRSGRHGTLFNPDGLFSNGSGAALKKLSHTGQLEWSFKRVPERVFVLYREFLRTKNVAYLHQAERELR